MLLRGLHSTAWRCACHPQTGGVAKHTRLNQTSKTLLKLSGARCFADTFFAIVPTRQPERNADRDD